VIKRALALGLDPPSVLYLWKEEAEILNPLTIVVLAEEQAQPSLEAQHSNASVE
jgi:hypothetical protein